MFSGNSLAVFLSTEHTNKDAQSFNKEVRSHSLSHLANLKLSIFSKNVPGKCSPLKSKTVLQLIGSLKAPSSDCHFGATMIARVDMKSTQNAFIAHVSGTTEVTNLG